MVNYHITTDNRRLRCDATVRDCKYGAAHHFPSAKAADAYLSLARDTLPQAVTPAAKRAQQALNAPLTYTGEPPAWWSDYQREVAANDAGFDIKPEIIDIIDAPTGPLAVIWQQETQDKASFYLEMGLTTRNVILKHMVTGNQVGYLRLEYMDDTSRARSFGTDAYAAFRYRARFGGSAGSNYDDDDLDLNSTVPHDLAMKQRLWHGAQKDVGDEVTRPDGTRVRASYAALTDAPSDEKQLDRELQILTRKAKAEMNNTLGRTKIPFVSFARLEQQTIGQGLGTAMYVYAARKLAQEGMSFRASDTQSGYGQAIWKTLKKYYPQHVKSYSYKWHGRAKRAQTFDFR